VKSVIQPDNLPDDHTDQWASVPAKDREEIAATLCQLLLEVSDDIASGHNTWFSWGATKEKTSFTATLYQFAGQLTIYDTNAVNLLSRVRELL
jgi:hypothetical protein